MFISKPAQFTEFLQQLRQATEAGAPLALDTEFLGEKRYFERLCLVQIHAPTETGAVEAALDPFTLDLAPLARMIEDPSVVKLVHAGAVDLKIFFQGFGARPQNVFDTQIAAAFLGYGHQIGYADLVKRITRVQLSKTMQYTDWSARPLSDEQIDYALADVRYLPPLFEKLRADLEERHRLQWAQSEFGRAIERATRLFDDRDAFKKLNLSGLSRKQLAVLREGAATRETIARGNDKPPSFVLPDLALIQMARQQPKTVSEVRAIRGITALPTRDAQKFVEAIETALASPVSSWPDAWDSARPDARLDSIIALLGVVVSATAAAQDVSRSYLAPREALFELATHYLDGTLDKIGDLPVLQDWRGELVGRDLVALLRGGKVVGFDDALKLPVLR